MKAGVPSEPSLYDKLRLVVQQLDEARAELASARDQVHKATQHFDSCNSVVQTLLHEYDELVVRVREI